MWKLDVKGAFTRNTFKKIFYEDTFKKIPLKRCFRCVRDRSRLGKIDHWGWLGSRSCKRYDQRGTSHQSITWVDYGRESNYGTMEESSHLYTKEIRGDQGDRSDHGHDHSWSSWSSRSMLVPFGTSMPRLITWLSSPSYPGRYRHIIPSLARLRPEG
jgi:hypothetical protein